MSRTIFSLTTALALAAALIAGAGGCNNNKSSDDRAGGMACRANKGTPTTVNTMCVVNHDDPVDPSVAPVDYKGTKYGLCCEGCRKQWTKMSDSQKEQNISEAMAASKK